MKFGLKNAPGQMQPTSRALRPGTTEDKSSKTSDATFNLGKLKGPKTPSLPKGPTKIGKGVSMPKFPKGPNFK